ncbi:MAG: hypothetical protein O7D29_05785 [Gemmatimonadetes bacterium]|nr:hypothetical protein [Gemmatimonadota bacterium]
MQKLGLSEYAKIAEILGGVVVVMSVIYLAVQISDNNRLLRSQAHFNALELTQDPLKMMVENDGLASMIYQCNQAPNDVLLFSVASAFSLRQPFQGCSHERLR